MYYKKIHHEFEGGIGKKYPEDHRLTSRGLPNVLSHIHKINGFYFLLTIKYRILCFQKAPEAPG